MLFDLLVPTFLTPWADFTFDVRADPGCGGCTVSAVTNGELFTGRWDAFGRWNGWADHEKGSILQMLRARTLRHWVVKRNSFRADGAKVSVNHLMIFRTAVTEN